MADIKIINGEITSITQGLAFNTTLNSASGSYSTAFGNSTTASATASHAEGQGTLASGTAAHAEGDTTTASGAASHAGGNVTIASGLNAFNHSNGPSEVNGNHNAILGGEVNNMTGTSTQYSAIIGGANNLIKNNQNYSGIFCGANNTLYSTVTQSRNIIIGGTSSSISNASDSVIINGNGISISENNTTYIGGIKRGGYVLANTLAANVSSTSTTPADITGWSFNAVAGGNYLVKIVGTYQTAATTTGGRLKIAGTATCGVGGRFYGGISNAAVATELAQPAQTMTTEFITTGTAVINVRHHIGADIIFQCTGAGTIKFQWGSEVAASTATLAQASSIIVERID